MTNRTMTVYLPNGARYFHTESVMPADETREEDVWVAQGYVVVFTESAATQVKTDVPTPSTSESPNAATAADHSKDA